MMDAYAPIAQTFTPCAYAPANDQPWSAVTRTETIVWFATSASDRRVAATSNGVPKFYVLSAPSHAGLERLHSFKGWQDNWDAEGGIAPDNRVIDVASQVFSLLALHEVPKVGLSSDGYPMFMFSGLHRGEVVVTGVDTIEYFFANPGGPSGEDVAFDGDKLPEAISDYLGNAFA
jgi:hypothetical protein